MYKIMSYIICVLMLSMATVVSANVWTNATGDGKWNTAGNWSFGVVPRTTSDANNYGWAAVDQAGSNACVVDGTTAATAAHCQWLVLGDSGGDATVNVVAGGQLGTLGWGPGDTVIARTAGSGIGTMNIDGTGSVAKSESWNIGADTGTGKAIVNITNGGKMICGNWGLTIKNTGTVNIITGEMIANINLATSSPDVNIIDGGKIVIYPSSKLTLPEDQTALLNGYVAAGKIVGATSRCPVEVSFDEDLNKTYVTVPNCTCTTYATGDFNRDCYVDFFDLANFVSEWLNCTDPINPDCL